MLAILDTTNINKENNGEKEALMEGSDSEGEDDDQFELDPENMNSDDELEEMEEKLIRFNFHS